MSCIWTFQSFLVRPTIIEKYLKSSTTPTIDITNVTLTFNETFQWTFSGLNINILRCPLDSVQSYVWSNDSQSRNKATIAIHNSSFGSLDLEPGTKAQITDCYIDGQMKQRPTLIRVNNSDVWIQNCHFESFVNDNGSTILFGHNNGHVTIENSVFNQHNSSKGVLFLNNNSSLHVSSSSLSQNVALTLSYSTITLKNGIHTFVKNTTFKNNTAFAGGTVKAQNKCLVTLVNCTFSSNKAITGKTLTILKNLHVEMPTNTNNENGTIAPWSPASFKQTLLLHQKPESITRKKRNILKRSTRRHLHQRNFRTITPISPTLFNQTSSRLETPEDIQAERINNYRKSTARRVNQNNTGKFKPIVPMLFNQTSSASRNAIYQTHHLTNRSILRNTVQQEGYPPGLGGAVEIVTQSQLRVTELSRQQASCCRVLSRQQVEFICCRESTRQQLWLLPRKF